MQNLNMPHKDVLLDKNTIIVDSLDSVREHFDIQALTEKLIEKDGEKDSGVPQGKETW